MLYNKFRVMLYNMYACYVKSHLSSYVILFYVMCHVMLYNIKFLVISQKKRYVI